MLNIKLNIFKIKVFDYKSDFDYRINTQFLESEL